MCTAIVLLVVVGTVTAQLAHDNALVTTQAATRPEAAALQLVASAALVGAGLVVWFGRARGSVGPAVLGAAVALMAPVWIGWDEAPLLLQSASSVVAPFLLPCLIDIATGFPDRRVRDPGVRALVLAGYLVTGAYVVTRAAVYDPFLDPQCWANCLDSSLVVHAVPELVPALELVWQAVVALLGLLLVVASVRAWAQPGSRRWEAVAVMAVATIAGLIQSVRAVLSPGPEDPRRELLQTLFLLEAASLVVLATTLAWAAWRRGQQRAAAMRNLAAAASEAAGIHSLTAALAAATGQPGIQLGYWVPAAGGHVDSAGRPLADGTSAEDVSVLRGETPVALVRPGGRSMSAALVEDALGPAARLALDNERLRAEEMYHLQRISESRARIVAASDRARRELERDLHDGAQQRLLAVMYSLQMAATASRSIDTAVRTGAMDRAVEECRETLAELRDLAHGTFPAILESVGLAAALAHVGDRSRVALSVDDRTGADLPDPVAHAVYLAVVWALAAAAEEGGRQLRVGLSRTGGNLVVTIDGAPPGRYVRTYDRVDALGGRFHTDDDVLTMEIPCA